MALDFIFGKVQTNALLAILNARRAIKGQGIDEDGTSTTTSRRTASKKTAQIQRARTRGTRVSSLRRMGSVSDESVYDIRGSMALHSSDFATSEVSLIVNWLSLKLKSSVLDTGDNIFGPGCRKRCLISRSSFEI